MNEGLSSSASDRLAVCVRLKAHHRGEGVNQSSAGSSIEGKLGILRLLTVSDADGVHIQKQEMNGGIHQEARDKTDVAKVRCVFRDTGLNRTVLILVEPTNREARCG